VISPTRANRLKTHIIRGDFPRKRVAKHACLANSSSRPPTSQRHRPCEKERSRNAPRHRPCGPRYVANRTPKRADPAWHRSAHGSRAPYPCSRILKKHDKGLKASPNNFHLAADRKEQRIPLVLPQALHSASPCGSITTGVGKRSIVDVRRSITGSAANSTSAYRRPQPAASSTTRVAVAGTSVGTWERPLETRNPAWTTQQMLDHSRRNA
jgi:hypothetical protein